MLEAMTTERGESIQDVDSLAQRLQQLDDSSQVTPADEQLVRALVGASNANTANSACQVCRHRISNPLAGHKIDAFNSVKKREKRYPTNACCV